MQAGKNKRAAPKNKEAVSQRQQPKRGRVVVEEKQPEEIERYDILSDDVTPKTIMVTNKRVMITHIWIICQSATITLLNLRLF